MRRRFSPLKAIVYLLIAFLYLPLVVVVLFAFNGGSNLSWPVQGLSFRWFNQIFADSAFRAAFAASAEASFVVAIVSIAIATAGAMLFVRHPGRFASALRGLTMLPAMMPPLFIGVALFAAMAWLGIAPGFPMIAFGQVIVTIPFVVAVIVARLRQFDPDVPFDNVV